MKLERTRDNVFALTATARELSALVGAARMSLEAMERNERAPAELVALAERLAPWLRQRIGLAGHR